MKIRELELILAKLKEENVEEFKITEVEDDSDNIIGSPIEWVSFQWDCREIVYQANFVTQDDLKPVISLMEDEDIIETIQEENSVKFILED